MTVLPDILRGTVLSLYCLTLAIAAASDAWRRIIPNWTVILVAVLFCAWVPVGRDVSIPSSLEAALIVFVASAALYAFRLIGAGDSKLITVVALFVGLARLPLFLLLMSLAGGALAAVVLLSQPRRALAMFHTRGKGDFGRGIPYGVAIAIAGVLVMLRIV